MIYFYLLHCSSIPRLSLMVILQILYTSFINDLNIYSRILVDWFLLLCSYIRRRYQLTVEIITFKGDFFVLFGYHCFLQPCFLFVFSPVPHFWNLVPDWHLPFSKPVCVLPKTLFLLFLTLFQWNALNIFYFLKIISFQTDDWISF